MTTPIAYSIQGAAEALGVSVSHVDRLVRGGIIRAKYTGEDEDGNPTGKRLVLASELQRYAESLVDA